MQKATRSIWQDGSAVRFPPLVRHRRVNVVVIGGGAAGITAAYQLTRAGRSVVLLERRQLLGGDTAQTTSHLTCVTDMRLSTLVDRFGRDHATAVWDAGLAAIGVIDKHVRSEGIACDFEWVPGYLHLAKDASDDIEQVEALRREAALAAELGFDAEYVNADPWTGRPAMLVAGQARIHPLKYLRTLLQRAVERGCAVYEESPADEIADEPLGVIARGTRIDCDYVVVATHNPPATMSGPLRGALLQTRLALYTSYVVGGTAPRGAVPDALFWDTSDPYRYCRINPSPSGDLVILGGEDHKTGQPPVSPAAPFERLERALHDAVPDIVVSHRWSGQVIQTADGLPFIGEVSPRQFIATGFAGNGITFGTLAGLMATDAVIGRANPWNGLFDLDRSRVRGLWNYLKENKDYPYYLVRDRFAGADSRPLRMLRRGEGRIVELHGRHVAAYRAADGQVTLLSPVCTHMRCTVAWNPVEQTWDCPCHGSRFSADGRVLAGPAQTPLEPVELEMRA